MFGMGHYEIIIVLVVILLVFGAKRIPEMAQGLGKGIKEFKKALREVKEEVDVADTGKAPTVEARPTANQVASTAPAARQPPSSAPAAAPEAESGAQSKESSQG